MANSKKKTVIKASAPVKAKPSSKPASLKKKPTPAPVKKTSTPSKKIVSKPTKKVAAKSAPKKAVQKSGKKTPAKSKPKAKAKEVVVKAKDKVAAAAKNKGKSAREIKGKKKAVSVPVNGKSKSVTGSKSKTKEKNFSKGKRKKKEPEKKKRGRKKKNKGSANYQKIKAFILRRHKRRTNVETNKQAENVAKALYKYLKLNKKIIDGKITQKTITEALDFLYPQPKRKLGRLTIPEIPEWLQQPNAFYDIEQVNQAMNDGAFRNVWIYSPMILGKRNNAYIYLSPTVTYTYDETFKDWVDWINEEIAQGTFQGGSPPEIFYRFKAPFRNSLNNRWEVKLISCDDSGSEYITGYIPQGTRDVPQGDDNVEERFGVPLPPEGAAEGAVTSPITPPVQTPITSPVPPVMPPSVPVEPKELTEKKMKSEETREKGFKMENLVRAKNSIMEDLRFNKEMGFPLDTEAMARLVAIRKEIDDLTK